jgi:MscS family membrane protein
MEEVENTASDVVTWVTDPAVIQVFVIVFVTLSLNYVVRRLLNSLEKKVVDTVTLWDDALFRSIRKPLGWLIWLLGISWAAEVIAAQADTGLAQIIDPVRYIGVVGLLALFGTNLIREVESAFIADGSDITTANAVGKLLRISVLITAALMVLQTLGVSISGILAFGGVGGIAVGFAARDILANFFGGLMIYLDRPFKVGEWIRSPDREVEGTVVSIGWRSTEIRTFDQRPLFIPNSVFATIALENPSRMLNRRIYETIGIRYADVDRMALIVDGVRELLQNHPDIAQDKTLIVNFNSFSPSSIDFFVYTFTRTTDWIEFHHIKQKVLLQIIDVIQEHGAQIAFPTSEVHLVSPEGPDA